MTPALPRTNFNSSGLIRLLTEFAPADRTKPGQDFAERLAGWLDVGDAITLSAALGSAAGEPVERFPRELSRARLTLQGQVVRVKKDLIEAITADGVSTTGKLRIKLPTPVAGESADAAADFSRYHRYYVAHQREMDSLIGQLRITVRATISKHSPQLAQLAALDAVLAKALAVRERNLLAAVPGLLEKRFDQLRPQLATAGDSDPARWMLPGGWLAIFCQDLQQVLLAELELRLQPVLGLLEAFSKEVKKQQ